MTDKPLDIPWFVAGLAFECAGCGGCCAGPAEGYVWVTPAEVQAIAAHLGLDPKAMLARHVRQVGRRQSLKEDPATRDCEFLRSAGPGRRTCAIYSVRPVQCRTWPFWASNLASPDDWAEAACRCTGINRGAIHSLAHIRKRRDAT
ncbi:MAG: YkgJ family cysteine cluster protein, partial [Planctomycetota bacterium]|nr:YkgJ family cysteine cluster protein [Planctomycetota bacterium]